MKCGANSGEAAFTGEKTRSRLFARQPLVLIVMSYILWVRVLVGINCFA
jgi:hypothetical protein